MEDEKQYDFSGWATKNDIECSDGRIIMKDAFIENDGKKVPLVWMHQHNDPTEVLGHALLENRSEGVYAYCKFNDTESGNIAKRLVINGDVDQLSIYANKLRSNKNQVVHGIIREVSLVLAGANPGAFIDSVIVHSDSSETEEEATIYNNEFIENIRDYVEHSDDAEGGEKMNSEELENEITDDEEESVEHSAEGKTIKEIFDTLTDEQKDAVYALIGQAVEDEKESVEHSDEDDSDEDDSDEDDSDEDDSVEHSDDEKTIEEVLDTLTDEQKTAVYAIVGEVMEDSDNENNENNEEKEGEDNMKHNVFDKDTKNKNEYLAHSEQEMIINTAKKVGSFQEALAMYAEENEIQHDAVASGFNQPAEGQDYSVETLFPEYKEVRPGEPELITNDQGWVSVVLNKLHKSPISRIRTSQVDIRNIESLRAKGYIKGKEKGIVGNFNLLRRTTDPQTVYVKNALHRDDIIDITDFDYVNYLYKINKMSLNEELATAIMIGDGREAGADGKIETDKIRPIWTDDDLYTLHVDLDIAKAREELQGTNTGANFGDNYVIAEAMINTVLYARENYKGTGTPDFYCTPRMLNVMMLARDLNGRRIYNTKAELASALDVAHIYTAEQFANKTRTTADKKTKKLAGIICNLADYSLGATKGGQVTHFTQFDIDFNQEKSLLETRCSGALTRVYSAIAIEEDVTEEVAG